MKNNELIHFIGEHISDEVREALAGGTVRKILYDEAGDSLNIEANFKKYIQSGYIEDACSQVKTGLGISSVATTCMELLGYVPPADYDPSIITIK